MSDLKRGTSFLLFPVQSVPETWTGLLDCRPRDCMSPPGYENGEGHGGEESIHGKQARLLVDPTGYIHRSRRSHHRSRWRGRRLVPSRLRRPQERRGCGIRSRNGQCFCGDERLGADTKKPRGPGTQRSRSSQRKETRLLSAKAAFTSTAKKASGCTTGMS